MKKKYLWVISSLIMLFTVSCAAPRTLAVSFGDEVATRSLERSVGPQITIASTSGQAMYFPGRDAGLPDPEGIDLSTYSLGTPSNSASTFNLEMSMFELWEENGSFLMFANAGYGQNGTHDFASNVSASAGVTETYQGNVYKYGVLQVLNSDINGIEIGEALSLEDEGSNWKNNIINIFFGVTLDDAIELKNIIFENFDNSSSEPVPRQPAICIAVPHMTTLTVGALPVEVMFDINVTNILDENGLLADGWWNHFFVQYN